MSMKESPGDESLGLGLKPGDSHYRAYVGPPEDFDLIAAMTFNLLTTLGLRQHHSLLDIGCGSLRAGRLFIPYLNTGKYFGLEPNEWLVEEGIERELGRSILKIKQPKFIFSDSPTALKQLETSFDFAVAQSIFSHCGLDLIDQWLAGVAPLLSQAGALIATFVSGDVDSQERGWIYPGCVSFEPETLKRAAEKVHLRFEILDWRHPRQVWALFAASGFDDSWLQHGFPNWNARMDYILAAQKR
jgi:SAM-dependent methyltransferase